MLQDSGMLLVPTPDEPPALSFRDSPRKMIFWISNLEALAMVHGSTIIEAAFEEVERRLAKKLSRDAFQMVRNSKDIPADGFDEKASDDPSSALILGAILAEISSSAISVRDVTMHVALMGKVQPDAPVCSGPRGADQLAFGCQSATGHPPNREGTPSSSACSAAQLVADFFGAVGEERITLAYRPVCSASGERVLHYECLPRVQACDGHVQSEAELRPAIERFGLARAFDRLIASMVVEELFCNPSIHLAVAISVASAIDDVWWVELWTNLARRPDVAARLIVVITDASSTIHLSSACRFVSRLRRLGCGVGLSGFGICSSLNHVIALQPDIVEIDPFLLSPVARQRLDMRCLAHVAGIAAGGGRIVVAAGVRDRFDLLRVRTAGLSWWQGQYSGPPTSVRPWKMTGIHLGDQQQFDQSSDQGGCSQSDESRAPDLVI